jgi:hypothetical protein
MVGIHAIISGRVDAVRTGDGQSTSGRRNTPAFLFVLVLEEV